MGTRRFYVYILASRIGGTLYVGVTNDLIRRIGEHKLKVAGSFTKKYEVSRLVYFRSLQTDRTGDPSRKAVEEMAAGMEDFADRKG